MSRHVARRRCSAEATLRSQRAAQPRHCGCYTNSSSWRRARPVALCCQTVSARPHPRLGHAVYQRITRAAVRQRIFASAGHSRATVLECICSGGSPTTLSGSVIARSTQWCSASGHSSRERAIRVVYVRLLTMHARWWCYNRRDRTQRYPPSSGWDPGS
jgi:hypothetical protein